MPVTHQNLNNNFLEHKIESDYCVDQELLIETKNTHWTRQEGGRLENSFVNTY